MPAQEIDLADLARRVTQLEKALERIGERATRREDEWGTVRSKANKVDDLSEELRELRRLVTASPRQTHEQTGPPQPVVTAVSDRSNQSAVDAVLKYLKGQALPTTREETVALMRQTILDDDNVRQAVILWLTQELRERGVMIPPAVEKRVSARPRR